jgi:hypothetical protein
MITDDDDTEFCRIYGPDLYRKDHTANELRQIALVDGNLARYERVLVLAAAIDGDYSSLRGVCKDSTADKSVQRRASRLISKYKEGGLALVLLHWTSRQSPKRLQRFQFTFDGAAARTQLYRNYLAARLNYIRGLKRLEKLRQLKKAARKKLAEIEKRSQSLVKSGMSSA